MSGKLHRNKPTGLLWTLPNDRVSTPDLPDVPQAACGDVVQLYGRSSEASIEFRWLEVFGGSSNSSQDEVLTKPKHLNLKQQGPKLLAKLDFSLIFEALKDPHDASSPSKNKFPLDR